MSWDKFKTREWLMVIAILMIIEAFIFYCAEMHQKSVSALNYVSFAGTLTSIILAVIAIILSVVTTFAGKSTSESLHQSVESLDKKIGILDNISERIDGLNKHGEVVDKKLDELRELSDFSKAQSLPDADITASSNPTLKDFLDNQPSITCYVAAALWMVGTKEPLSQKGKWTQCFRNDDRFKILSKPLYGLIKGSGQIVYRTLIYLKLIEFSGETAIFDNEFREVVESKLEDIIDNADLNNIHEEARKTLQLLRE